MAKIHIKLNAGKAKLGSLMLSSIGLFALASQASAADTLIAPTGYVLASDMTDVVSASVRADGSLEIEMADGSTAIIPAGGYTLNNGEIYVEATIANDLSPYFITDSGPSLLMVGGAFAAVGGLVALSQSDGGPDNAAPIFTSTGTSSFAENAAGTAYTAVASDSNGDTLTYSLSGTDAALFNIDASSGAITFINAPDFEAPADSGADNVYNLTVTASDGVLSTTQGVVITVTNENDNAPVLTSALTASVAENETAIDMVTATDADGDTLTYSIAGGADAALFVIDSATGALSFAAGQDFEMPADGNSDNQYEVVVQVSDGTNTDSQTVVVTVTNANDNAPVFTSAAAVTLAENITATGYVAVTTDADGGVATYSITGGADAALLTVDSATGALSFIAAPDFDVPADANGDNVFDVIVTANDGANTTTQTVAVTLTNVNDNQPVFTSAATVTFDENGTATAYTAAATDGDGDTLTYSIAGGGDAALFTIDAATGAVSFVAAPDFELPTDADGDNNYDLIVRASDGAAQTDQSVTISVNNINDNAPVVMGGSASVAENSTATGFTATATDADGSSITFSIAGGADAALFAIDASTGALSFIAAPDFDQPGDAGADNVYDVIVQASDGVATDTAPVAITVTNLNDEIPVFTSGAAASVNENITATGYSAAATDGDGDTLSYSISGGADGALFTIDSATGALSFVNAPDFESPTDVDTDNDYDVIVTASDGVNSSTQTVMISVQDVVNEGPVFSSGASASFAENGVAAAYTAAAATPNTVLPISYSITGGDDASLFVINAVTGDVSFLNAPDFESPGDTGADNGYSIEITASDGTLSTAQLVTIAVTDVNDVAPTFTSGATASVAENSTATLYTSTVTDPDGGTPTYSIVGGADSALFTIDSTTGELSLIAGVDFESPSDANTDSIYDVTIEADDGVQTTSQAITVSVTDVDEAPTFNAAFPTTIAENSTGTFFTAGATDPEGSAVTYTLSGTAAFFFSIDSARGELTVSGQLPLDFESGVVPNNIITGSITASDGSLSTTQNVSFQITDVNEAPTAIPSGFMGSLTFARSGLEGDSAVLFQGPGFAQFTSDLDVTWDDPENAQLTFTLSGTDAAAFTIDAGNNLVITNPLDFENPADADNDNVYEFNLTVSDGVNTFTQAYTYTVRNDADIPVVFTSGTTANTPENLQVEPGVVSGFLWQHTPAYTAEAVDGDNLGPVTYSITGGVDAALFTIDIDTGEVRFVSSPDFENPGDSNSDNVYDIEITANDGTSTAVQSVAITVDDVTGVQFASPNTTVVNENRLFNGTDALVLDAVSDTGAPITYTIVGGADASSGLILQRGLSANGDTFILGVASFRDFENPVDANQDNVYEVIVQADDGTTTATQTIFITIADIDDTAPTVTSATTASVAENSTLAYTLTATDVDTDDTALSYFIQGNGPDNALFTIDRDTGELSFITPPDFENPVDANSDNVYQVTLLASDGTQGTVHTVSITVTDVIASQTPLTEDTFVDLSDDDSVIDLISSENNQVTQSLLNDDAPGNGGQSLWLGYEFFMDMSDDSVWGEALGDAAQPPLISSQPFADALSPGDLAVGAPDMFVEEMDGLTQPSSFFQIYDVA